MSQSIARVRRPGKRKFIGVAQPSRSRPPGPPDLNQRPATTDEADAGASSTGGRPTLRVVRPVRAPGTQKHRGVPRRGRW